MKTFIQIQTIGVLKKPSDDLKIKLNYSSQLQINKTHQSFRDAYDVIRLGGQKPSESDGCAQRGKVHENRSRQTSGVQAVLEVRNVELVPPLSVVDQAPKGNSRPAQRIVVVRWFSIFRSHQGLLHDGVSLRLLLLRFCHCLGLSLPDGLALGLQLVKGQQSLSFPVPRWQHYGVVQELVDGVEEFPSLRSFVSHLWRENEHV